MGYFIKGYTNKAFRIRKENFKPAFKALCQLNANDSLKGGGGGNEIVSKETLKKTFATDPNHWFGWVDWNFDNNCKNLIDVLRAFGFIDFYSYKWDKSKQKDVREKLLRKGLTFNDRGDLTSMFYNSKNGDVNYVLDTIAPYVDKGGKMFWHGEDGQRYTTDFNSTHPFNAKTLNTERKDLINLLKPIISSLHYVKVTDFPFSTKNNLLEVTIKHVASKLGKYAVACGGQLSSQTKATNIDMASEPFNLVMLLLHDDLDDSQSYTMSDFRAHVYPDSDLANEDVNSSLHLSSFDIDYSGLFTKFNVFKLASILTAIRNKIGINAPQSKSMKKALNSRYKPTIILNCIISVLYAIVLVLKAQKFNQIVPSYIPVQKARAVKKD